MVVSNEALIKVNKLLNLLNKIINYLKSKWIPSVEFPEITRG